MQELNLDVASEFLVMAATLIHIKSRQLLPRPESAAGIEDEEIDPRDALVRRLVEHQRFKAAAELLHERETLRSAQWTRPDSRVEAIAGEPVEPELEVDLFGLLAAFRRVLERAKESPPVLLPPEQISIETRIEQLLERLSETEACGFEDLFDDVATRGDLIVTFLALLEMIRLKLVRVFQQGGRRRSASTSGPGPRTRRIRSTIPRTSTKAHHRDARRGVAGPRRPAEAARARRAAGRRRGRTRMSDDDRTTRRRRPPADAAGRRDAASTAPRPRMDLAQLKAIVEALVFASPEPLTTKMLFKLLADEPKEDVQAALDALVDRLRAARRPAPGLRGRRLSDHHPPRAARLGAAALPRAQRVEAVGGRARDAVGRRLPPAGDRRREPTRSAASTPAACCRRCSSGT